ncbi:MAG: 1-(5-phosphoribosyl)-5-((5-phosphoribosylamino)methylideneamino)imidazole-4-carboxamide isomerase, partial [Lachnospiraceae bacterium]|nr:1-(5-phosphoribosyl)-5-((5-phosphoribosylamino)methylideneamino)imidazole-4-carboxamide isomerase [Lachnospiraceae bacterium]
MDIGGGIRTKWDVDKYLQLGAKKVCLGTISITDEQTTFEIIDEFGRDRIILCPDVYNEKVAIHGWKEVSDVS